VLPAPPADNHVHSQWSYDTFGRTSMVAACQRAVEVGVPAIAFTEHLDFTDYCPGDAIAGTGVRPGWWEAMRPLDVTGYLASIEECRQRFGSLRILSGVEAGEPHLFAGSIGAVLATGSFDRVLGSLHALAWEGRLVGASRLLRALPPGEVMRRYLAEVVALVEGSGAFEILAHLDYPRRYWPASAGPYAESDFEEEYRAVLRALASSGRVLEVNTYSPLVSVTLLRWWREEGGAAVSFGSDAHVPSRVADNFRAAVGIAEAAGFRRGGDLTGFWRR
jgi:histidinol-phosphatase (PHP family)